MNWQGVPTHEILGRLEAEIERLRAALYKIAQGGNKVRTDWPAHPAIDRQHMSDIAIEALQSQQKEDSK